MKHYGALFVFLVLVFAVASIGAVAHPDAWFEHLSKPWFNPPNWVFAPVWTLLYLSIAIAGWRVYRQVGLDRSILLWAVQLLANALWSPLFFALHAIGWALADIVFLLAAIAATIVLFRRRDVWAAWLMVPYLAWVAFATLLNASLFWLNPAN